VRQYFYKARTLAFSATAKDTYVLFSGNLLSAFLGFLFTILIARGLSVEHFGIYSASTNLIAIIVSLTDIGISSAVVNFIARALAKGKRNLANAYIHASFVSRIVLGLIIATLLILFSSFISQNLLATTESQASVWVALISFGFLFWSLFPFLLQAQKRFLPSVLVDIIPGTSRLLFAFVFFIFGVLTLRNTYLAFFLATVVSVICGLYFIGTKFIFTKPRRHIYVKLLKFSGWLGVNRIVSSISGKLDVQMLANLVGATATGLYSIPARLASFLIVLTASFSGVLAPRLAAFDDKEKEKQYILKATLAMVPIVGGIIIWVIIARPFILILFGEKYLPAVNLFRALALANIPFVLTAPSVTAIIYAMKKTVYIGTFSFFQLTSVFLLNLFLIPKFGAFGPTITFGITNTVLAIYTWVIVIRHYWTKKG
jgi:O-antigen/teichoic acid export membrane protein